MTTGGLQSLGLGGHWGCVSSRHGHLNLTMYLLRMKEIVKKMMTVTIRDRLLGHLFFMLNFFFYNEHYFYNFF